MSDIKPGQWIKVTVKSRPRAAAGQKTMRRLFGQDQEVRRERQRQDRSRPMQDTRRGGRIWKNKPPHLHVVDTRPGASYRIFASVETLRALDSIRDHVEITPAG